MRRKGGPLRVSQPGTLAPETIDAAIADKPNPLQQCVDYAIGVGEGRADYELIIAADGSVRAVRLAHDSFDRDALTACVGNKIAGWDFPAPVGGEVLHLYRIPAWRSPNTTTPRRRRTG
jgi:hypothetical protein